MTTLQEISTNSEKNFEYWSMDAKFHLSSFKTHSRDYGENHAYSVCAKSAFKESMQNRKTQMYLNEEFRHSTMPLEY